MGWSKDPDPSADGYVQEIEYAYLFTLKTTIRKWK